MYTSQCCDMIAVKREVAAVRQVFPRSECQKAGSIRLEETDDKSLYRLDVYILVETTCEINQEQKEIWLSKCFCLGYTRESVQSPLVVLKS